MAKTLIPGRYRYADAHDMYALLGVKSLPPEGMPERLIHGVRVYVKPLAPKVGMRRNFQGLRVMAICKCGQHLPVGRMHQHICQLEPTTPNVPNLDAMNADELMTFWMHHQRGRNRKELGLSGRNSMNTTGDLACYASNKATAISCRLRGDITAAQVYEQICDGIYKTLPSEVKW